MKKRKNKTKSKKIIWENRINVKNCKEKDYCDCPYCAIGVHCMHEDSEDGDCIEESCPRFNGKLG